MHHDGFPNSNYYTSLHEKYHKKKIQTWVTKTKLIEKIKAPTTKQGEI